MTISRLTILQLKTPHDKQPPPNSRTRCRQRKSNKCNIERNNGRSLLIHCHHTRKMQPLPRCECATQNHGERVSGIKRPKATSRIWRDERLKNQHLKGSNNEERFHASISLRGGGKAQPGGTSRVYVHCRNTQLHGAYSIPLSAPNVENRDRTDQICGMRVRRSWIYRRCAP